MIEETQEEYKRKFELVQAMAQLDSKEKEVKMSKGYGKAYLWSLLIPPIGIFYFIKYLFFTGGEKEDIKAGIISLVLTLLSFFISLWLMADILKLTSSSQDIQTLKDLTIPANQKQILQLFK